MLRVRGLSINLLSLIPAISLLTTIGLSSCAAEFNPPDTPDTPQKSTIPTKNKSKAGSLPEQPFSGEMTITGTVISGGDQTPEGRMGGPRQYIYQIKLPDGIHTNIMYLALPPSPTNNQNNIDLEFHAGEILIGDYIIAYGNFDEEANMLTVKNHDDYIYTFPEKP